jgi:hypothetical protein
MPILPFLRKVYRKWIVCKHVVSQSSRDRSFISRSATESPAVSPEAPRVPPELALALRVSEEYEQARLTGASDAEALDVALSWAHRRFSKRAEHVEPQS